MAILDPEPFGDRESTERKPSASRYFEYRPQGWTVYEYDAEGRRVGRSMGGSPAGQFGFVSRSGTARIDSHTPKIVANLEVRCLDVLDIFTGGLGYYEILGDRFQPNVDILFDRVEDLLATVEHRNLFAVIAGNSDPVSSRK